MTRKVIFIHKGSEIGAKTTDVRNKNNCAYVMVTLDVKKVNYKISAA